MSDQTAAWGTCLWRPRLRQLVGSVIRPRSRETQRGINRKGGAFRLIERIAAVTSWAIIWTAQGYLADLPGPARLFAAKLCFADRCNLVSRLCRHLFVCTEAAAEPHNLLVTWPEKRSFSANKAA